MLRMQMSKGLCILLSALIQDIRRNIYHESSKVGTGAKAGYDYDHYSPLLIEAMCKHMQGRTYIYYTHLMPLSSSREGSPSEVV